MATTATTTNTTAVTIAQYKNTALTSIKWPANAAVLVKERETLAGGNVIEALIVEGVKNTKPITLVKHLLVTMLADFKWRAKFDADHKEVKDEAGKTVTSDSGVRARNLFTKFLGCSVICKTDAEGSLSYALQCDKGVTLRNTALAVRKTHAVALATDANTLRACIHNQASAIVAQCTQFSEIAKVAIAIAEQTFESESKAEKKSTKKDKAAA